MPIPFLKRLKADLVILDRDGVINVDSPEYIKSPEEWHPIPGSLEAIALLNQKGYQVAIATNQSGLGRGLFKLSDLEAIHNRLRQELILVEGKIDAIFYCPHLPSDHCHCRKPKPGLFWQIRDYFQIDLGQVYAVGDSLRDWEAATSVGAHPVLVLTGNGQKTLDQIKTPSLVFNDLISFVQTLPDFHGL